MIDEMEKCARCKKLADDDGVPFTSPFGSYWLCNGCLALYRKESKEMMDEMDKRTRCFEMKLKQTQAEESKEMICEQ